MTGGNFILTGIKYGFGLELDMKVGWLYGLSG